MSAVEGPFSKGGGWGLGKEMREISTLIFLTAIYQRDHFKEADKGDRNGQIVPGIVTYTWTFNLLDVNEALRCQCRGVIMGRYRGFLLPAKTAVIALLVLACAGLAVEKTVYVGPSLVDCTGDGMQKCLMVREDSEGNWTLFQGVIERFAFQPGFQYTLKIKEEEGIGDASGDSRAPQWTLVEVLDKLETPASGLDGRTWKLVSIRLGEQSTPMDDGRFSADFDLNEGTISGLAGCDRYSAAMATDGNKISISTPEVTKKTCPKAVVDMERRFFSALENANSFVIEGDSLKVHYAEIGEMIFWSANETAPPQADEVQMQAAAQAIEMTPQDTTSVQDQTDLAEEQSTEGKQKAHYMTIRGLL